MNFFKNSRTNWKYILIVVILAVIVGGGILVWIKRGEVPPLEFPEIKKPEKIIEDKTADWKTYRNEEAGFQIEYPKEWGDVEEIGRLYGEGPWQTANLNEISVHLSLYLPPFDVAPPTQILIEYVTPTFIAGRELSLGEILTEITKGEGWVGNACFSDILLTSLTTEGVIFSCTKKNINGVDAIESIRFLCPTLGSCEGYVDVFEKVVILKTLSKKFPTLVFSTNMQIRGSITVEGKWEGFYSNTTEGKAKMEAIVEALSNNTPTDIVDQEMINHINNFDNLIKTVQILK